LNGKPREDHARVALHGNTLLISQAAKACKSTKQFYLF